MKRSHTPISVKAGHLEFLKLNTERYDWRDAYHSILTLTWPQFAGLIFGVYVLINILFATLYWAGGKSIAELPPGSFADAFFFRAALRLNFAIHSREYIVPRHFGDPQWHGAGSSSSYKL